jgi:Arc/MetJ-type ribon-helix-helix transcriptional regulator
MVLPIIIPKVNNLPTRKIAITIDGELLDEVDSLVGLKVFRNRSNAIQQAIAEKLDRMKHVRLGLESRKLNAGEEQEIAEEGVGEPWPEY